MSSAIEVLHQEIREAAAAVRMFVASWPSPAAIELAAREAAFAFSCAMAIEILEAGNG